MITFWYYTLDDVIHWRSYDPSDDTTKRGTRPLDNGYFIKLMLSDGDIRLVDVSPPGEPCDFPRRPFPRNRRLNLRGRGA